MGGCGRPSRPCNSRPCRPTTIERKDSRDNVMHDYRDALHKSLLFYRAQRSGDLSGGPNPIPWRTAPSFLSDGADVGVDLSKGYFDAGDYVKYGQPLAYTLSVLAWSGIEYAEQIEHAGSLTELKLAVRWGTDYILQAAKHISTSCTFYAQVGRGAAKHCRGAACKFDHGYWGRPEDYHRDFEFASLRRTYRVNATHPGIEIWAAASAALSSAHLLFERDDRVYAAQLLGVSRALFACATAREHNVKNLRLQEYLPEVCVRAHEAWPLLAQGLHLA